MIPFRRILFPVDFSKACDATAPYVKAIARRHSAELTLLHAFELPPLYFGDFGYAVPTPALVPDPELRAAQEKRLQEFAKREFSDLLARATTETGDATAVIRHAVEHEGFDLVMMSTHGQGGFRRLLLGSVTTKVLHDLSCAVWTGTHAALEEHSARPECQSIVCALGQGEEAAAVLRGAAALAKSFGASLALVSAVEMPPAAMEIDLTPYLKDMAAAAQKAIRQLADEAGVDAPVTIVEGPVADVVRREAAKRKADLIVVGRGHAHGLLGSLWSRLYGIIRESPCPVLSV
jgi:nucleotide-binding universal stress UspA family protein